MLGVDYKSRVFEDIQLGVRMVICRRNYWKVSILRTHDMNINCNHRKGMPEESSPSI